jgi:hypothetical protein
MARDAAARALVEYQDAEHNLKTCKDKLEMVRARELLKSQQWKLERTLRRIYGDRDPTQEIAQITLNINLRRDPVEPAEIVAEPSQ